MVYKLPTIDKLPERGYYIFITKICENQSKIHIGAV